MATTETRIEIKPIETKTFHAMPPAPRHAITTHFGGWENLMAYSKKDPAIMVKFVDFYPRFIMHRDVKKLTAAVLAHTKKEGQLCFLFPAETLARQCRDYICRPNPIGFEEVVPKDEVTLQAFFAGKPLYGVFVPMARLMRSMPFWQDTGMGISSRHAERCLDHLDTLREIPDSEIAQYEMNQEDSNVHEKLRQRVVDLAERAPISERPKRVGSEDVYLFQTGMSAVYLTHLNLLSRRPGLGKTVQFGVPFHQTLRIFEHFGPGIQFYPLATEYDELENFLESESRAGTPVSAIWTEVCSNPLLGTADLPRLRKLADKYSCALVLDDTIASFSNVDLLDVADVVVTSLTKSFSGYADVMGGSTIVNPNSATYDEIKASFAKTYFNYLFPGDAETLLKNSEDYLTRSRVLNDNAFNLAQYLHSLTKDPASSVSRVYYPPFVQSYENFKSYMRPSTAEFTAGHGCLLSLDFHKLEQAIAFVENFHVHLGPHLGAHKTLCIPYTPILYREDLEKVARWGLNEGLIRISVGLEDSDLLLETLKHGIRAADAVQVGSSN